MEGQLKAAFASEIAAAIAVLQRMAADSDIATTMERAVAMCVATLDAGGKLLFAGNGGSAADAQHWAGELVSRFHYDRPGLAAIALTTDSSILTAIGNDYGYERVFARQVEALGRRGDILVAISTSGGSRNVLAAIDVARARGLRVIGFTGASGDAMAGACDLCFRVPATQTPRIQEGHEFLGHLLCQLIEARLFPRHDG